jgi:hypothetical protein
VAPLTDPAGGLLIAAGVPGEAEYEKLERVSGPAWSAETLSEESFSAAFPLGDGRVGLVAASDSGAFAWRLLDGPGRTARELFRFVPTEEETVRLGFFDQYQGSHSPISPQDGTIAVAGADVGASRLPGTPQLYVVPTDGSGSTHTLGPGRFGTWDPGSGAPER